jgi:hypothetical protein
MPDSTPDVNQNLNPVPNRENGEQHDPLSQLIPYVSADRQRIYTIWHISQIQSIDFI